LSCQDPGGDLGPPERYLKSDATDVPKNAPDAPESQQISIILLSGCIAAIETGT
jgi:hypothetical protein